MTETVTVEALPLDEYLKDVAGEIALIKIDVEGAEGFVLKGMQETFRKNPRMALLMEFYPTLIRRGGSDPVEMLHNFYAEHDIGLATGNCNRHAL